MCQAGHPRVRGVRPPRWGWLHAVVAVTGVVLVVVQRLTPAGGLRVSLDVAVSLAGFGALAAWARLHPAALDLADWCECAGATVTVRVIAGRVPRHPAQAADAVPALALHDGEGHARPLTAAGHR